ncbi:MAG: Gfo/Idh/MocA family oxidoreductase [Isosphaeraceae bacterium]
MNLRWGILGCARIRRRGLIPGIQASKTGRLVALASRNPATAHAWCEAGKHVLCEKPLALNAVEARQMVERCVFELVGTRGVIDVPDAYLPPTRQKPIARLRTIGSASDSDAGTDLIKNLEFEMADQYEAMIDAFATSLAAGRLVEPAEDGLAQMKALDAIMEAARS